MTYEEIKGRKKGYQKAMQDIEKMGFEWAKHMFVLQLKCTGLDPYFTVGYGEALVEANMRAKVTKCSPT